MLSILRPQVQGPEATWAMERYLAVRSLSTVPAA